jgi:glycosyltransferase involved in cell wall biosynthesis
MSLKKKCFLVSYNGISNAGGVEKVCYYLNDIMKENYEVILVDKSLVENSFWAKKYIKILKKLHITAFTFFASLYVKNKRREGDILISHGFNAPFFKIDYLFVHGTMKGYAKQTMSKESKGVKALFFLEKLAVRNSEKILAVSQNAVNEVKKYYNGQNKKFFVVQNGVDTDVFYPKLSDEIRQGITILYCGRLDEGKGLSKLLKLASDIENMVGYNFIIACNNISNTVLFEKFEKTKIKIGLQADAMNDFYNSGDILYFPSLYEGFEMVTLEALAAGIPVLGNDVGAVSELVKGNMPGVEIIDNNQLFSQIDHLVESFKMKKTELHEFYEKEFGLKTYTGKLNKVIQG